MMSAKGLIGVVGATSLIGEYLLPLLVKEGWSVEAFSRLKHNVETFEKSPVTWQVLPRSTSSDIHVVDKNEKQITHWIFLAPIEVLPDYYRMLLSYGATHIVAVSSTSRFTKKDSFDAKERKLAESLAENEERLTSWAKKNQLTFTILRPTLIYSPGRDRNISVIAGFIRRFSFFCVFGAAEGLRQPVHAQDVAFCCAASLSAEAARNKSYNISGGEIINYREMVCRIFSALDKKPWFVEFPFWLFRVAVFALRIIPRYRHWSATMALRMNQDMIFDHAEASRDLNFHPRNFKLTREDFPGKSQ